MFQPGAVWGGLHGLLGGYSVFGEGSVGDRDAVAFWLGVVLGLAGDWINKLTGLGWGE